MSILPSDELLDSFNQSRQQKLDDAPLNEAMALVSNVVRAIHDAGFNIGMSVHPRPTRAAFYMFSKIRGNTVSGSGCIRVADVDLYFGICTEANGKPCTVLGLLWSDIRYDNKRNPHGGTYDLNKDTDVEKLQIRLIEQLAMVEAMRQIDAAAGGVLQQSTRLNKPKLDM
jgi:hypothetical protein